jgi:hypothetical protein
LDRPRRLHPHRPVHLPESRSGLRGRRRTRRATGRRGYWLSHGWG